MIAGDSIMRQFFNSAVSLFRGQGAAMDYNKHAHARYLVCKSVDSLAFGTFQPQRWEIPLEEIHSLYSQLRMAIYPPVWTMQSWRYILLDLPFSLD